MRKELQLIEGQRQTFAAIFVRFGSKPSFRGSPIKTALFKDIMNNVGKLMCDHIWFTVGKQMEAMNLQAGDTIVFDARVAAYQKGYKGRRPDIYAPLEIDYRLTYPTRFRRSVVMEDE